jgi:hypothetical protein
VEGGGGGGGEAVNEGELFSPLLFSVGVVKNQRGVVSGGVSWRLLGHVFFVFLYILSAGFVVVLPVRPSDPYYSSLIRMYLLLKCI